MLATEPPSGQNSLKPAPHQVAGHRFEEGRVGSLVDEAGRFYKPLQSGDRGSAEAAFYQTLHADQAVPAPVLRMFPRCYGVVEVPGVAVGDSNGGAKADADGDSNGVPDGDSKRGADGDAGVPSVPVKYLVMEDLTAAYRRPCVMDIKMGRRTWYEGAPQNYIDKCLKKDASTTSGALGYRIAGLQVYDPKSDSIWRADRNWCKMVTIPGMPAALARFLSDDPGGEGVADRALAEAVLSGPEGLMAKLGSLRAWLDEQITYQFYSASILVVYEGKPAAGSAQDGTWSPRVSLRLVDFAHVIQVNAKDKNFLDAVDAVMSALKNLV